MDAMAFGMGCCCLQVTFQAKDLAESRYLYDQLSILSPICMALTAGSPVFRGKLVDTDTRWDVISSSVDCRTPAERGLTSELLPWQRDPAAVHSAGSGCRRIYKSRYDSIDCFISNSPLMQDKYNDLPLVVDEGALATLVEGGVDERLARHIAHLFIRDPLVIFQERITSVDDHASSEHFENIQSTNWQNVRWKPPPPDNKDMGWRVELRTMEVQLTDAENAAFTVFAVLMSRVILFFELNLYIPTSKVDENMAVARLRNAITEQKFHFRSHVVPLSEKCGVAPDPSVDPDHFELMTCEEILTGKGEHFPGLVPIIFTYLDIIECDDETRDVVSGYLYLIVQRAKGNLPTFARWYRQQVMTHPAYKRDSNVSQEIAFDVLDTCRKIASGELACPELLGSLTSLTPLAAPGRPSVLRGASFHEAFPSSECAVLQRLLARHVVSKSFAETAPFLSDV